MKTTRPGQPVTSNDATNGQLTAVSPADHPAPMPGGFTEPASWALVIRHAQCSDGGLDPDQWFPVSADPGLARQEAAAAIAICATCPVRFHCLTLSLQHWDIGQHGIWGGLDAADRARLRRRVHAGQTAGRGIAVVRDDDPAVMSRVTGDDRRLAGPPAIVTARSC
jgi:hypothetical protein